MRRSLVALLVAVTALAACGAPKNKYLAQRDERVYLRVPGDWVEIEMTDADRDFLTEQSQDARLVWRAGATADENAHQVDELTLDEPFALVKVYEIDGVLNQNMSVSLARVAGAAVGFDPVLPSDDDKVLAEVLSYEPADPDKTLQGSRAVFRTRNDATEDWTAVVDMTTYFDPTTFRLYVLRVACSPECYEANEETITKIANSWSVEP
ncbi:MAG: hypothetical protein AB7Q42_15530 [Acidimicrobiia bacterium]